MALGSLDEDTQIINKDMTAKKATIPKQTAYTPRAPTTSSHGAIARVTPFMLIFSDVKFSARGEHKSFIYNRRE